MVQKLVISEDHAGLDELYPIPLTTYGDDIFIFKEAVRAGLVDIHSRADKKMCQYKPAENFETSILP